MKKYRIFESLWIDNSGFSYRGVIFDTVETESETSCETLFDGLRCEDLEEDTDILWTIETWEDGKLTESVSRWNSDI